MKNLAIILLAALVLSGCQSFLEEDDRAGITNDELYKTEAGYETLRINAYNSLRLIYNECPLVMMAGTDLYQMGRGINTNGIFDYRTLYDTNSDVETFYKNCYTSLQAINAAEFYLNDADISDETKKQYQGEYDFMKGFVHFILLEEFGGLVISDEYTQEVRLNMPRKSLEDTYTYIIGKLEAAEQSNMSQTPPTSSEGKTSYGQICKDMVNHYLAKVYLTRAWDLGNDEDFETAKTYAQKVIDSRGGALKYSMEQLWSPGNENNDEVIFAIQYDKSSITGLGNGNNQESMFGSYMGGPELNHKYMTSTSLMPSWSLHSWYDKNDARYEATFMLRVWEKYYDYYNGKNVPGTNKVAALYPRAWDESEAMFNEYVAIVGQSNGAFTDVSMHDENGQLRNGVIDFIKKWCPEYETADPVNLTDANGKNMMVIYPFFEHGTDPVAMEKYWRSGYSNDFCQPCIKKFDMDHLETFSTTQSYRDIVLATLSETMLLYAEACIGQQDYTAAQNMINEVLKRPGNTKDNGTLTVTLSTGSQEEALEDYLKESGKELAGQYCGRWPELRRTKMLKHMFYKYNYDYLSGNLGNDPIGEKLYRPIPQSAIEINEGLSSSDQNPGY